MNYRPFSILTLLFRGSKAIEEINPIIPTDKHPKVFVVVPALICLNDDIGYDLFSCATKAMVVHVVGTW